MMASVIASDNEAELASSRRINPSQIRRPTDTGCRNCNRNSSGKVLGKSGIAVKTPNAATCLQP
jgi:hypothetical protein